MVVAEYSEPNINIQIALTHLQGARPAKVYWPPFGLRGRGAAIKAAAIKSENALADDLEIVSGDLATPASVSVKLDKLTQSCKVLLPTALSEKVGKLPTLPAPEHSRFPSGLELRTIIRLRYIELCSNLLQIAGERTPQGHSLSRGRHGS